MVNIQKAARAFHAGQRLSELTNGGMPYNSPVFDHIAADGVAKLREDLKLTESHEIDFTPVTREWLIELLGDEESTENHWKVTGSCAVFSIALHDIKPVPLLAVCTVQSGLHPVCDVPAISRETVLLFTQMMGISKNVS